MTKLERLQIAKSYYPNATPELNYETDLDLILAVMLSAQTTDKAVNVVTTNINQIFTDKSKISEKDYEQIFNLIKPIGLAKRKTENYIAICQYYYDQLGGALPNDRATLVKMPGVGQKTANVVLAILFDAPYMAVDTHVHRICKRLKIIPENRDVLYAEQTLERILKGENINQYHQSLIYFGRYHCLAKNPKCNDCKLQTECRFYRQNKQ